MVANEFVRSVVFMFALENRQSYEIQSSQEQTELSECQYRAVGKISGQSWLTNRLTNTTSVFALLCIGRSSCFAAVLGWPGSRREFAMSPFSDDTALL